MTTVSFLVMRIKQDFICAIGFELDIDEYTTKDKIGISPKKMALIHDKIPSFACITNFISKQIEREAFWWIDYKLCGNFAVHYHLQTPKGNGPFTEKNTPHSLIFA